MRHDVFIALELRDGRTVYVNPDAVCAVEQDSSNEALCYVLTGHETMQWVKGSALEVVQAISQCRERRPDEDD